MKRTRIEQIPSSEFSYRHNLQVQHCNQFLEGVVLLEQNKTKQKIKSNNKNNKELKICTMNLNISFISYCSLIFTFIAGQVLIPSGRGNPLGRKGSLITHQEICNQNFACIKLLKHRDIKWNKYTHTHTSVS